MDLQIRGELVDNETAELLRWYGFSDLCCPADVTSALEVLPEGEELTLLINSPGGDMTVGTEVYSLLRRKRCRTVALVQGFAASAATLLLQGATVRRAEPGALICVHNPSLSAGGDYRDLQGAADSAANAREAILDIYTQRSPKSRDELGELMNRDIWISAAQAVEFGILDEVQPWDGAEAAEPPKMAASAGMLHHVTAKMRADFSAAREAESLKAMLTARQRQLTLL